MKSIIDLIWDTKPNKQFFYPGKLYKTKREFYLRTTPEVFSIHEVVRENTILLLLSKEKVGISCRYVFLANNKKLFHFLDSQFEYSFFELFSEVTDE